DISKGLSVPINTIEYNLQKLIKAGLVEKAKKHFWSVKGRKIDIYKLANKHIVISPKQSKPSMSALKVLLPILLVFVAAILILGLYGFGGDDIVVIDDSNDLRQFGSMQEMKDYLEEGRQGSEFYEGFFGGARVMATDMATGGSTSGVTEVSGAKSADDYSTTNVQVEGVDEADMMKNDDKYIYTVSGGKVVILDAYPAEDMKIVGEIDIENSRVSEMYLNDDKLILFISNYGYRIAEMKCGSMADGAKCGDVYHDGSAVLIYDVSDRSNPVLDDEILFDGQYIDSRMIGDHVYVISNKYINSRGPEMPVYYLDGVAREVAIRDVSYMPYIDDSYTFTLISAIDVNDGDFNTEVFLLGRSHTVYVSEDNIYLTYTKYISPEVFFDEMVMTVFKPLVPNQIDDKIDDVLDSDMEYWEKNRAVSEVVQDYSESLRGDDKSDFDERLMEKLIEFEESLSKKREKTVVHKLEVDDLNINYKDVGEAPGRVLNQFSMDEHDGNFRIATTTGNSWGWMGGGGNSLNHLYILDDDLDLIGSVEDLAKGERIYSVRFMGDRAYMVTFRQVDPLFVIDVSDAYNPEVLGYLKITGFSNYLHPYDENHIIGIGKDATEEGLFQGMKISLFDVSDVNNPVEKAKYEIGDRGTNSYALYDHHAFMFDKERNILVIPVDLAEINESKYEEQDMAWAYGDNVWQGAYVFNIDSNMISLRGMITHDDDREETGARWYYAGKFAVKRSLFMDNYLYTVSDAVVKAHNLQTVHEISKVDLGYEEEDRRVYY
ncbi:MAG: beta-propeller domain-containing protein, partial [Nanoarchaeota archaeon]|nr:beta-propeller domain-containing protein [Nanoarchaeota archaeon]